MQFMADVTLVCETCGGKRFKEDVLEVKYNGANVFDILEMTVNQALNSLKAENHQQKKKLLKD